MYFLFIVLNRATSSASPFVGSLNEEDTASHDGFSMKDGIDKVIFKLKMAKKQKEETPKRGAEIPVIGQASQESSSVLTPADFVHSLDFSKPSSTCQNSVWGQQ